MEWVNLDAYKNLIWLIARRCHFLAFYSENAAWQSLYFSIECVCAWYMYIIYTVWLAKKWKSPSILASPISYETTPDTTQRIYKKKETKKKKKKRAYTRNICVYVCKCRANRALDWNTPHFNSTHHVTWPSVRYTWKNIYKWKEIIYKMKGMGNETHIESNENSVKATTIIFHVPKAPNRKRNIGGGVCVCVCFFQQNKLVLHFSWVFHNFATWRYGKCLFFAILSCLCGRIYTKLHFLFWDQFRNKYFNTFTFCRLVHRNGRVDGLPCLDCFSFFFFYLFCVYLYRVLLNWKQ